MKKIKSIDISGFTKDFTEVNISAYSGQAAFFLMLSFFPFMMFFFALLDLTPLTEKQFSAWAMTFIPESFWNVISEFIQDVYAGSSGSRLSVTIIIAIYLSSKAFLALTHGLNSMYQVKETRNIIRSYLYSMLYSVVFAFLLIFILGIMVFGNYIYTHILKGAAFIENILQFRTTICIPVLFVFFLILYTVLPNKKQKIRYQIPGAIVAAAGWIIFSFFFSVYVDKYTRYASFYGTMTTIALIMVWLYGCMYVLFIGGFMNRILEEKNQKTQALSR